MYKVSGDLCQENANAAVAAGLDAIRQGEATFDCSHLSRIDSTAVVAMLAWQRQAQADGKSLQFIGLPAGLLSLIGLYGLHDQFHLESAGRH